MAGEGVRTLQRGLIPDESCQVWNSGREGTGAGWEGLWRSLGLSDGDEMPVGGSCWSREGREGSWKVELQSNEVPQKDGIRKNTIRVSVLVWRLIPVIPVLGD